MAKDYFGEQSLKALTQLIKTGLAGKVDNSVLESLATTVDLDKKADKTYVDEQLQLINSDINDINETVEGKVSKDNIVNDLNSTDSSKVLSAKQGNVLKDLVDEKVSSTTFDQHLEDVNAAIDEKLDKNAVVNGLNSTDSDKALAAAQGKALNDRIDNIMSDDEGVVESAKNATSADTASNATQLDGHDADYFAKATDIPDVSDVIRTGSKGVANGVATLDSNGLIPSDQLPSYVDDVIEGYISEDHTKFYTDQQMTNLITGERGKIYVDITNVNTTQSYRWSGSVYTPIVTSDMVEIDADTVTAIWNETMGITE